MFDGLINLVKSTYTGFRQANTTGVKDLLLVSRTDPFFCTPNPVRWCSCRDLFLRCSRAWKFCRTGEDRVYREVLVGISPWPFLSLAQAVTLENNVVVHRQTRLNVNLFLPILIALLLALKWIFARIIAPWFFNFLIFAYVSFFMLIIALEAPGRTQATPPEYIDPQII
ncbi:hypothetical protein [Candidatus Similichlamydia epinepheli]|uniref:hypothetical protein n=1 Tax=Candidatus Similichlamydia epinepheli TaxID=1903953 RepID=UPI000D37C294|nr:hypothetical protein [Candidatus Similichlamydia epinepheli]